MKSADGQGTAVGPGEANKPFSHLAGGFVGERHRQDTVWAHAMDTHEICDAVGNDPGLAAPRPGNYEQGAVHRLDGLPLCRIQSLQQVCNLGH